MQLEDKMRKLEYFSQVTIPPNMWVIVRVDGNKFSKLTKQLKFEKPYDINFQALMVNTAMHIADHTGAIFTETHSDEISLLFPPEWDFFGRRAEKISSICAGLASSKFSLQIQQAIQFDGKIWMAATKEEVLEYYTWRALDSSRNALYGYCFYKMLEDGYSNTKATTELMNKNDAWKNEFLFQKGINYNDVPAWQKRGVGIYWDTYEKEGFNPITKEKVLVNRRNLHADYNMPMKGLYQEFIQKIMDSHESKALNKV